jgi:Leucine-rich repeat (LRR) protein
MAYLKSYSIEQALREPKKVQRTSVSAVFNEDFTKEMLGMTNLEELEIDVETIPEWIVQFPKLRKIEIRERAFMEGKAFEILAKIPSLREVEICFFTDDKRDKYVVPNQICLMKQITQLEIIRANTFPPVLDGMDALECLILSKCDIKDFPEGIKNLPKLEQIEITGGGGVETLPPALCMLPRLKVLKLDTCRYNTLPLEIGCLKGLKELIVINETNEKVGLKELPKEIGNLTELELLNIGGNLLTDLPKEISNLKKLEWLSLEKNGISKLPMVITSLEKLKVLILNNNPISELPKELSTLAQLESLEIRNSGIKCISLGIDSLLKLKKLDLGANELKVVPEFIGRLVELESLSIGKNQIKELPEELKALKKLKKLVLSDNEIQKFPTCIFGMEKLEEVYMSNNKLTELPENLPAIQSLNYIGVNNNRLKQLPESIKLCKNIQKLGLEHNPLEEEGFMDIWMSMPWCKFYLSGTIVQEKASKLEENRKRMWVMEKFAGWENIKIGKPVEGMDTYWFGHRSEEPTPHIIGPDPSEVFHEKVKLNKLMPFLTVDLHALRPEWQGKAHFLVWDYSLEYLTFQLKENKYIFLEAGYSEVKSLTALFKNLDAFEDFNPKKVDWNVRSNLFFPGMYYAMEPFHLPVMKETKSSYQWLSDAKFQLSSDPRRFFLFQQMPSLDGSEDLISLDKQMFLTPKPIWLQSDSTPVDPEGKVMEFVGQIDPSVISGDLPDGRVYMFYSPKHQIITLVGQCT